MNCRVAGLDREIAVLGEIINEIHKILGASEITADPIEINANYLCRDIFVRLGFISPITWEGSRCRPIQLAICQIWFLTAPTIKT